MTGATERNEPLLLRGARIIASEGWHTFWIKFKIWANQRRLMRKKVSLPPAADWPFVRLPELRAFVGDGDFEAIGQGFLTHVRDQGILSPDDKVLDVGCGIGRAAIPLTQYLSNKGEYQGFDIVKRGIDWCQKNISSRYPNFHFQLAEIYNKVYNPRGRLSAKEFRFPYKDNYFDFIFLLSVFTHILPEDMEHYLDEIQRVLKKGGRCLITFFLLNSESLDLIKEGKSTITFKYTDAIYAMVAKNMPEAAVAYDEAYIRTMYQNRRLAIREPILYGFWCGRQVISGLQDTVVADKV